MEKHKRFSRFPAWAKAHKKPLICLVIAAVCLLPLPVPVHRTYTDVPCAVGGYSGSEYASLPTMDFSFDGWCLDFLLSRDQLVGTLTLENGDTYLSKFPGGQIFWNFDWLSWQHWASLKDRYRWPGTFSYRAGFDAPHTGLFGDDMSTAEEAGYFADGVTVEFLRGPDGVWIPWLLAFPSGSGAA